MRIPRLSSRNKLLALALLVGCLSGGAAVLLHFLISLIKTAANGVFSFLPGHWQWLVLPGVGMLISLLIVRYIIKDNISHGVTKVLQAISNKQCFIKAHNVWSSVVTSAVTIGLGGSVGAEAPIVYTGAAIGSNLGRRFGMSYRQMTILLGCGAAGALAGIFKAPLAGVLFTMEILLFNISMSSLMPLLLSTVAATVISYIFTGSQAEFAATIIPFRLANFPFYCVLGAFCGLFSVFFVRSTLWLEDRAAKVLNPYKKWASCAVALGLLIFLFPPLYGEGYDWVRMLLNGGNPDFSDVTLLSFLTRSSWGIVVFFALVMVLKVFSMTFTNAGGGVGGTFGPTLFVGAIAGFVIARVLNLAGLDVPESNFVLVGMAAMMAGVMQAPLTAIFLIAEVTGGYDLFLPLILTAAVSFGTTRIFEKYSIYTKRIAQTGELLTHDSDQAVLTLMSLSHLVSDKYPRVSPDATLSDVVNVFKSSDAQVYAVVDDYGVFCGEVTVDNIHSLALRADKYDTMSVRDFMDQPPAFIYADDKMEAVMDKFDKTGAWRLPVVTEDRKYVGYASRSRILAAYREMLKDFSQD
jgi:chloride channel protein, CIC family